MEDKKNTDTLIISKVTRDWALALIFAVFAALVFRYWFYEPYKVPTSSMKGTIEAGDHVFVSKKTYGFHNPFSDKKWFPEAIKRGDVVVFPYPLDPKIDYIKRVIAVGGDKVQIEGETVFINGTPEPSDYLYFDPALLSLPENIEITIPKGKLWVMGDNRRNSKDSRYWGFVDEAEIIGKALMIFWSHDPEKNLLEGYRFDRIGVSLELMKERDEEKSSDDHSNQADERNP